MKKQIKKILCVLWGLACVCLPLFFQSLPVSAPTAYAAGITDSTMKESNTNVDIHIDSQGYYHITETMDITFYASYSEFLRDIPYENTTYVQENGQVKKHLSYAQISNVSASWENANGKAYQVNTYIDEEGYEGYYTIGVKSQEKTRIGETRTYSFSYTYYPGTYKDYGYQGVYFNIIGHMVSHERTNITFSVTFPSNYHTSENNVMVYYGVYGSNNAVLGTEEENPQAYINTESETVLTGYIQKLGAYEGLTVQVALPEGYFDFPQKAVWPGLLTYVILLAGIAAVVVIYMRKYKRSKLVEPVEVTPPDNLIPLKCGAIFKEKGAPEGITSMIVYMANKGYLTIEEKEKTIYLHKKNDAAEQESSHVKRLLVSLFSKQQETVCIDALPESFYTTAMSMISEMKPYADNALYGTMQRTHFTWIQSIPAIIAVLVSFILALYTSLYLGFTHITASCIAISIGALIASFGQHVFITSVMSVFILSMAGFEQFQYYKSIDSTCSYFVAVVVVVTLLWFILFLKPKFTKEGAVIKGRVNGFRNYLQVAEKSQLEMLVEENPNYFYDILPYTYALNVSDVWMEKFKDLHLKAPEWYISTNVTAFDVISMHYVLSRSNRIMQNQIHSHVEQAKAIARSMGGFSSGGRGGGFSGGGVGGGGSRAR